MTSDKKPEQRGILTSTANVIVLFANSMGIPLERITKSTGVKPMDLMHPDGYISKKFFLKLLTMLVKARPGKNMSLEFAKVAPFTVLGSSWRIFNMAPDLGTMLDLFVENSDLISAEFEIERIDKETEVILRMDHPLDDYDKGIGAEIAIGVGVRILREHFGDGVLTCVMFRHKARSEPFVYKDYFKVPVICDAPFNGLSVSSETLERKNKKSGEKMKTSLKQNFSFLRKELGAQGPDELEPLRKAIVRQLKKGDSTVSGLAKSLAMSLRSLQRLVRKSGISASSLIVQVRYNTAMELLADKNLSVEEIAFKLGFDSDRSFRRAFNRWAGKSPVQARKELFQD